MFVVLHHCTEASVASLVNVQDGVDATPPVASWMWWAAHSPLHLLFFGVEPVYVFFVLSGVVLVLPILGKSKIDWTGFFIARLVRLYLPSWGSLVVAAALLVLVPHAVIPGRSSWLNGTGVPPSVGLFGEDATLLSGGVNGPLWSLRYEVLFSLLVPLYLLLLVKPRGSTLLKLGLIAGAVMFGAAGGPLHIAVYRTSEFMAMFAVGVMMANDWSRLTTWVACRSRGESALLVVASLLALSARGWTLPNVFPPFEVLSVAGAAILVLLFAAHPGSTWLGTRRPTQWIGTRSFSLYLIHVPIVTAVAELMVIPIPGVLHVIAVPLCLLGTEIFYRLVEKPSQQLGRHLAVQWRTSHA